MRNNRFISKSAVFDCKHKGSATGLFVCFFDDREKIEMDWDEETWVEVAPERACLVKRYQIKEIAIPAWLPSFFWPDYVSKKSVRIIADALLESKRKQSVTRFKENLRRSFIRNGKLSQAQLASLFKWDAEAKEYFKL